MANRVYNFSAGPAVLPEKVLQQAADEMLDYQGCGMSVMELSHRSTIYQKIIDDAEAGLRKLMDIPENYKVLFLQGGASLQFLMVPMNLGINKKADFVNTGEWSTKAIKEAKKFGMDVNVVATSEDTTFNTFPEIDAGKIRKDADYFHITSNNTIYGTKCMNVPKLDIPVVADMSSNIMSEKFDVRDYGIIYAGAQKNIGPAGVVIVIIREDLVGKISGIPTMLDYKTHVDKGSMFNTPPTYGIYIAKLVFDHMLSMGGVAYYEELNKKKAALIYDAIDNSKLFKAHVKPGKDRSLMNIPFFTDSDEINKKFLKEAEANGLVTLKGHRSVGGMRASVYNAMPIEGCQKLADFIKKFDQENS
ncbi:MAG: phosphoserine aminotransferase [Clostridiales bacterium]|jgi:phosphoserine aminotransferase|nr:phosphoserine aminotransferase [Clostridiales bacterium]MDN5283715.1 phosphoserine aminotransferase [Candidatus Ozemobacter sp.]